MLTRRMNIQHPTSNAQHPIQRREQVVGCSMLDVGCWMFSNFKPAFAAAAILFFSVMAISAAETNSIRAIIPDKPEGRLVDTNTMAQIYDEVKTPLKYGVVLKGAGTNEFVDCPSIFRSGGHWYMMYVAITNKVGYQTFLARSDNLLHWEKLGKILSFTKTNEWDAWQADGGVALADYNWNGSHELEKFDGKFWLSYIGGAKQGYETDPLSMGVAWTKTPTKAKEWNRLAENPVLSPKQSDVRDFEKKTLYKSTIDRKSVVSG